MILVKISFFLAKNFFRLTSVTCITLIVNVFCLLLFFPFLPVSNTCSLYQIVLLLLAFVAVPWMLVPKPFLLKKQHQEVCLVTFPYHKTAYFVSCFSFPLLFCSQLVSKNFECPFFLSFCFL